MQSIFLIGFMGSGKSTLGKKLAAKLKYQFIDLDEAICAKHQVANLKTFIEQNGFDAFRKSESETLKSLNTENTVISTGGGTPCYFDNMEWMKNRGVVVFLNVDEGVIYSRLQNTELEERPMLKGLDETGLKAFIHDKLNERMPYYKQAHISFNPVNDKIELLVEQIQNYVR